jgi:hypothetical protein
MDALVTFGEVTVSPFELLPALQAVPCYFYTINLMHSRVEVQGVTRKRLAVRASLKEIGRQLRASLPGLVGHLEIDCGPCCRALSQAAKAAADRCRSFSECVYALTRYLDHAFNHFQQKRSRQFTIGIQKHEMITSDFSASCNHSLDVHLRPDELHNVGFLWRLGHVLTSPVDPNENSEPNPFRMRKQQRR